MKDTEPNILDTIQKVNNERFVWPAVEVPDESSEIFTFAHNFDPAMIPVRPWILKPWLLRNAVSALLAPGGVGKSQTSIAIAVSLACNRDLLSFGSENPHNVLLINNEDSEDELKMRVSAVCEHYKIPFSEIENKIYMKSGYGTPEILAELNLNGDVVTTQKTDKLIETIRELKIDVLIVDPFISTHRAPENDNNQIDKVITIYKRIAKITGIAILIVHHTKKLGTDSEAHAGDVESSRGAKALTDAARCAFTLAKMSKATAKKLNIDSDVSSRLIRFDDAKQNYAPSDGKTRWFFMESVRIANGEWIGVPETFDITPFITEEKEAIKPSKVAENLNPIICRQPDAHKVLWKSIQSEYMDAHGISDRASSNHLTKLSKNKKMPTRIRINGELIDFWIEKAGTHSTAPWQIIRNPL